MARYVLDDFQDYLSEEDMDVIRDFINNTLNNIRTDYALVVKGLSRTGKTSLINVILDLIGNDKYDSISPSRKVPIKMDLNKRCTVIRVDDVQTEEINKNIISGFIKENLNFNDSVYRKTGLYGPIVLFNGNDTRIEGTPWSNIIFCCYDMSFVDLDDNGLMRRLKIVNMGHRF